MKLRVPPYAAELLAARRKGASPNLFVMVGDHSWDRAKSRKPPCVLCLPPADSFEIYDWTCVAGLYPTLIAWNWPPDRLDAFARHLVKSGAKLVAALGAVHEGNRVVSCVPTFYKPTRARAAA